MIKRTITYTNFADETVTEDWYFHMSKAEAIQLEASSKDGLSEMLKKIIAEEDNAKVFQIFKDLLKAAVGKRSADGKRFSKTPEIVEEFVDLGVCDQLIFDLMSDPENSGKFITGFLPKDAQPATQTINVAFEAGAPKVKIPVKDLQTMSKEDFDRLQGFVQ